MTLLARLKESEHFPFFEYGPLQKEISLAIQSLNAKPIVANAGLLNAGKSTLFNALNDHRELFPTGDARKTTVRQVEDHRRYQFIDTPGLDAFEKDSQESYQVFSQSQVILFVHSAINGELDAQEMAYLEKLARLFPDPGLRSELIIPVITKSSNVSNENIEKSSAAIRRQWEKIMGTPPKHLLAIRASTYLKGLEEKKEPLCVHSKIPLLREAIETTIASTSHRREEMVRMRVQELLSGASKVLLARKVQLTSLRNTEEEKAHRCLEYMTKDLNDFYFRHRIAYHEHQER